MLLSLLLMPLMTVSRKTRHSGVYMECARGQCGRVGDREVGWEFDQPEQFYMEREEGGDIRRQLEEYRMDIK